MAVYSFGKTFHITGWKMGYCIGPKELMVEFRKVHQFNVFSSNHPLQHALAEYLKEPTNTWNLLMVLLGLEDGTTIIKFNR